MSLYEFIHFFFFFPTQSSGTFVFLLCSFDGRVRVGNNVVATERVVVPCSLSMLFNRVIIRIIILFKIYANVASRVFQYTTDIKQYEYTARFGN